MPVGSDERRDEGGRTAARRGRDERILVERDPLSLSWKEGRDDRLHRRRRPADLGVRKRRRKRRRLRQPELVLHFLRGAAVRKLRVPTIERCERNRLDPLHPVVSERRHRANAVDGPGHEVAGASALVEEHPDELAARYDAATSRIDDDGAVVGFDFDHAVLAPKKCRAARDGLERVRVVDDSFDLSGVLEVGQGDLRTLHASEVAAGVGCAAAEIEHVEARVKTVGHGGVDRDVSPDDGARLVGPGGLRDVPCVAHREHFAFGRHARVDQVEVVCVLGRVRPDEGSRLGGYGTPRAPRARDPRDICGVAKKASAPECVGQRNFRIGRHRRRSAMPAREPQG